ncbi:hypothetical protein WMF31_17930 [Sorangium sp. So ce1036]|uniref:hypothetical protein n=1 Tax=Sorangium sp. So ce1036 TaxID=3133328 RepID=UPI003EFE647B
MWLGVSTSCAPRPRVGVLTPGVVNGWPRGGATIAETSGRELARLRDALVVREGGPALRLN